MRRDFDAWLSVDVQAGPLTDDLVLAVYEALADVAEHAYAHTVSGVGLVRLTAHRAHDSLRVTVADLGRWHTSTDTRFRDRGLALIRQLIAQVHIDTGGSGTSLHLRTALPPPESPVDM